VDSIDKVCPDDDSPASLINTEDIIKQVNKLPPGAKKIFQLHAIEGYSHREISKLLHISVGTSKSQINRAKQLLQHWIAGNQI
jgi:RNA polymerase sigma-70 factor (ECF subfamily)